MLNRKNFPGLDGFVWWTGVVENRKDPLKLERVLVRMYGWHTENKQLIPTDELHWAQPIFATNASNESYVVKEGDTIFGFYFDSDSAQFPMFIGRLPDLPRKLYPKDVGFSDPGETLSERPVEIASRSLTDGSGMSYENKEATRYPHIGEQTTSRLARNENIYDTPLPFINENLVTVGVAGGGSWTEPGPAYNAEYPYNDSKQSESGHYVDVDDTRDSERLSFIHRTGTYMEFAPKGELKNKTFSNRYDVIHGSEMKNVRGNLKSTTEKKTFYKGKQEGIIDFHDDLKLFINGNFELNVMKNASIKVAGKLVLSSETEISMPCGGTITISSLMNTIAAALTTIVGVRSEDELTVNVVGTPTTTPDSPKPPSGGGGKLSGKSPTKSLSEITKQTNDNSTPKFWAYSQSMTPIDLSTIDNINHNFVTYGATSELDIVEYIWSQNARWATDGTKLFINPNYNSQ